jgi:hypothetical protein
MNSFAQDSAARNDFSVEKDGVARVWLKRLLHTDQYDSAQLRIVPALLSLAQPCLAERFQAKRRRLRFLRLEKRS